MSRDDWTDIARMIARVAGEYHDKSDALDALYEVQKRFCKIWANATLPATDPIPHSQGVKK